LPYARSLVKKTSVNENTAIFHGLKAASQLLLLVEDDVTRGRLHLRDIAIDFEDGSTREFSAQEYIALAKNSVADAAEIFRRATQGDRA
jgi:hypothetical protein